MISNHIDLYIKRTKEYHKKSYNFFLSIIDPHEANSTSTVSHWTVEVLVLAGTETKAFTAHSTRSTSTFKAKILRVPTKEILKEDTGLRLLLLESFTIKNIDRR